MKNNIHIEEYYTGKKAFTLKCVLNGKEKTITVDRADFDEYVNHYDLREYSEVYVGHDGEPVENSGFMPWDEYYESDRFEEDLKEYVDACLVACEKKELSTILK